MMRKTGKTLALAALLLSATIAAADARCEGKKTRDTLLGAGAGGVVLGVLTHGSPAGWVGGAVLGGVAGHTIASGNCHREHYTRHGYYDRDHRWHNYS